VSTKLLPRQFPLGGMSDKLTTTRHYTLRYQLKQKPRKTSNINHHAESEYEPINLILDKSKEMRNIEVRVNRGVTVTDA